MALQEEFENQGLWLFKYRSYLPLVILLAAFLLYFYRSKNSTLEENPFEIIIEIVAFITSIAGLMIRSHTVGFTPKNTSGRNTKEGQVADTLNTSGLYSLVRHPLYVGNYFMWLGPVVLIGNLWFGIVFTLAYWLYYERIMFAEEQFLRKKFGEKYVDWSNKTPAFIPKLGGYKANKGSFNWKKVLLKEKNGLLATFLIFLAFSLIGEVGEEKFDFNLFFIVGSVVSILLYLIIKFLQKFTSFFKDVDA